MIGSLSLVSVLAGAATALISERLPAHTEMLERIGGFLLLAGLGALGSALRHIC